MNEDRKVEWTAQQDQAITARGRNVLVTASAGTGKTSVLSARAVSLVSDAAVCPNVTNMLVLTFTDAAAEQMRSRIARRLREEFDRTHERRWMRQLTLLQGADISTIHAFCKRLITENFHELSLDPAFRVIDGDEAMLLKVEVLDRAVEWAWHQSHLAEGLGQLLRRRNLRDASGFLGNIIRLNDFLDTVVSRDQWYRRAYQLAENEDPVAGPLGQAQRQIIDDRLHAILMQLYKAKKLHDDSSPGGPWGVELEESLIRPMAACLQRLDAGDWDGCARIIRDFAKLRAPQLRGFPEKLRELLKELRNRAIDSFLRLRDLAIVNPGYIDIVGRAANQQTRILVEVVEKFDRLYAQRKAALNGLDFADLEHYALRLLTVENAETGQRTPSPTALALRDRYKYIFVDEYQDINPVQQAILDALSSGNNVFVVGDVKQSIYAWRGAEPTIFVERLRAARGEGILPLSGSLRIPLNRNFRSAKGILDFVNKIFGRIMTATLAHVDYDEDAKLHPPEAQVPVTEPSEPSPVVELHILDETSLDGASTDEGDEDGSAAVDRIHGRQRQVGMIAQRIKELVGSESQPAMQIYDKDTQAFRDVRYGDIVILMRSLAKKANDYVEILRLAGIPVSSDATAGYFETTEISDVLCLLKVLDNPQRDIELAAVLRSPFFAFSDTELAQIRMDSATGSPDADFHAYVVRYANAGPDATLREKLKAALDTLAQWRTLARRGLLADLLWRIYRDTQYIAFVLALPNGQTRKANLLKLHDRAVQFEGFASSAGVPSVTRFVAFIEKLQEAGQDWTPAESAAPGNAVRILSVHKSKGLEFPVVFLAELESRFNIRDIWADVVMDADCTLGLQVVDPRSNAKLSSLAHQVIGEKRRNVTLAEEMRILYVAMTRARDRLILTASQKGTDCGKILEKGLWLADGTIPDWLLKDSKCLLEWVLYGLADQTVLHEAFDTGLADQVGNDALFCLTVHAGDQLRQLSQFVLHLRDRRTESPVTVEETPLPEPQNTRLWTRLKDRLNWSYPFASAVREPAKRSVTELTHQSDEFARLDFSKALERRPAALAAPGEEAPQDARLVGTAAHLVLSTLDLTQPITYETVQQTKERLISEEAMTASIAERIDPAGIVAFFESEPGALVCHQRNAVWREWPFTFRLPTSELTPTEDFTIVQGLIDVLVRTPGGLIVIDFKTDRVSGEGVQRRAEAYRGQVELYARATREILKHPVLAKWLYFLTPRQAVRL